MISVNGETFASSRITTLNRRPPRNRTHIDNSSSYAEVSILYKYKYTYTYTRIHTYIHTYMRSFKRAQVHFPACSISLSLELIQYIVH